MWAEAMPSGEKIHLHQDATVVVSEADAGVVQNVSLKEGRQAYLVCIDGSLDVEGGGDEKVQLGMREAAEIVVGGVGGGGDAVETAAAATAVPIRLEAGAEGAHFMVIEMTGQ